MPGHPGLGHGGLGRKGPGRQSRLKSDQAILCGLWLITYSVFPALSLPLPPHCIVAGRVPPDDMRPEVLVFSLLLGAGFAAPAEEKRQTSTTAPTSSRLARTFHLSHTCDIKAVR